MEVHWLETGSDSTDSPMLRAVFPIALENPRFFSQVPFDVVERAVDGFINGKAAPDWLKHSSATGGSVANNDAQEVPAQKWVDISDGKVGIALLNKTKYGHSYSGNELRITLMRSAGEPDIYPNLGKFNISYSLFPHDGDWKSGVLQEGEDFNIPVYAAEPPSLALVREHATRPEEASFFSIDTKGVALTGIKQAEEGNELIVRLAEMEGKETTVRLQVPVAVQSARRLNLIELPIETCAKPSVTGNSIVVKIRAHEIVTLGIMPK
jgi:alpha-mannosidase